MSFLPKGKSFPVCGRRSLALLDDTPSARSGSASCVGCRWQSSVRRVINWSTVRRGGFMTNANRLPVFEKFIQDARAAWAELPGDESRMRRVKVLREKFVSDPAVRE